MPASHKLEIRVLDGKDVEEYRKIRLEAVKKYPESFLGSYEAEKRRPLSYFRKQMQKDFVIGCFKGGALQGIVGTYVVTPEGKRAHSAKMWGFYVRPDYRGQGFAQKMLRLLFATLPETVEKVLIKVYARNGRAIKFYNSIGFQVYGIETKSLKFGGRYIDDCLMVKFLD